jgi:hypothetical protein
MQRLYKDNVSIVHYPLSIIHYLTTIPLRATQPAARKPDPISTLPPTHIGTIRRSA